MNIEEIKLALQLRDRSVRVLSTDGKYRAVCIKNTLSAQTAQKKHNLVGIPAALLAKTLAGASMAASFLKGEERIVIELDGNGPVSKIFAEAMQLGEVRGFVNFRDNVREFDFAKIEDILGIGLFRISRILYNRPEPIQGVVPIEKGDIATDLAYYYTQSEQIPTAVILDVDLDDSGNIIQSGGLMIQSMPGQTLPEIDKIVDRVKSMKPLTTLFSNKMNPQQVLNEVLPFEFNVLNSTQVDFFCRCSKDNFISKLLTLGLKEVVDMQNNKHNEMVCRYCNKHYYLDENDFNSIREQLLAQSN